MSVPATQSVPPVIEPEDVTPDIEPGNVPEPEPAPEPPKPVEPTDAQIEEYARRKGYQPPAPPTQQVQRDPWEVVMENKRKDEEGGVYLDPLVYQKQYTDLATAPVMQAIAALRTEMVVPTLTNELTSKGYELSSQDVQQALHAVRSLMPSATPEQQNELAKMMVAGYASLNGKVAPQAVPATPPARPKVPMPTPEVGGQPAGSTPRYTEGQQIIANSLARTFLGKPTADANDIKQFISEGVME